MPSPAQEEQSHVSSLHGTLKREQIGPGVDGFVGVGDGRYVRAEDHTGKSETEEFGQGDELKLIKASENQDWQALESLWYQYKLDELESESFPTEHEQNGVDSQRLFATIERKIQQKIEKKYIAYVDSLNLKKDIDTQVIPSRIKDHRLRSYIKYNGGQERIKQSWNKATKVDIIIGPHNDVKIMIKATGHNNDLTMSASDFFDMFSIPDVNKGFSRFQNMSFRMNNENDIRKIVNFFERVSVDGKLIGDEHNIPPIVEIVSTKAQRNENMDKPKQISRREKAVLDHINRYHNTRWHSATPSADQYASPNGKDKISTTDVNNRDIWKR